MMECDVEVDPVRLDASGALLEEPAGSPRDDRTDEVQHRQVVLRLLLPANQDASEAIHPGVRALNDPASRLEARLLLDQLGFFAARHECICDFGEGKPLRCAVLTPRPHLSKKLTVGMECCDPSFACFICLSNS